MLDASVKYQPSPRSEPVHVHSLPGVAHGRFGAGSLGYQPSEHLHTSPPQQVADTDAMPCQALVEPTPPQGAIQPPGNTQKRPRDPMGEKTKYPPVKQAKVEVGPSHVQVTGYLQQVSGGDDLLVLPPIPRDIYDELISSYDLLTLSYNDVNSLATEPETSEDEQERHRRVNIKH
ncbi:hypothetical protein EDB86DRAFT_3097135 [Lactarius hatsudake]|nr:hypothetical protein EDB86DRAFT_3097135 [Lactarius hatsudake]